MKTYQSGILPARPINAGCSLEKSSVANGLLYSEASLARCRHRHYYVTAFVQKKDEAASFFCEFVYSRAEESGALIPVSHSPVVRCHEVLPPSSSAL